MQSGGVRSEIGERLVGRLIDEYAAEDPTRVWASMPVDNEDLSRGFQDVTYRQFANAINHAVWGLKRYVNAGTETIAYAGQKDLRYPIIAVASLKLGKKLLLCSPFATAASQTHLLTSTNTSIYFCAKELEPLVRSVVDGNSQVELIELPEQAEWLSGDPAEPFPYTKTWEEAHADPWLIFHTSGTTGLPRPIIFDNWMMTSIDAFTLTPVEKGTMRRWDRFRGKRLYVSLPTLHFVGMTVALQFTTFLDTVLIFAPPDCTSASQILEVLRTSQAQDAMFVPSQISDIIKEPLGLETLRSLDSISFAGAPLPRKVAEMLVGHTRLMPAFGSTEAGAIFTSDRNENDSWEWYCFSESNGLEMRQRTDTLYELVFVKQEKYARWQLYFHSHPDVKEFATKDLWTRHPEREDLWKYAGRADDLVNFTHGESLYTTPLEAIIQEHPEVQTALIGGEGRSRPFVMVEMTGGTEAENLASLEPYIERANERCIEVVKLSPQRVVFAVPEKPLPRTVKDTAVRSAAFVLYEPEIERLYSST